MNSDYPRSFPKSPWRLPSTTNNNPPHCHNHVKSPPCVFRRCLRRCFSQKKAALFFETIEQQELTKRENEKDAHRKWQRSAIGLISSSSSISVRNPIMKNTHGGEMYGYLWIIQCGGWGGGVRIRQEGGVGGWRLKNVLFGGCMRCWSAQLCARWQRQCMVTF